MKSETYTLGKLLLFQRRYVIPTFQRDYEWTRDDQWELLIEDFIAAATRLNTFTDKASPHFLGAIVLDQMPPDKAAGLELHSVIDGQQRLTTIHLLIRALLDIAMETGSTKDKQLRRLLRNPDDLVESEQETHKLLPRRRDRKVWLNVMADKLPSDPISHPYYKGRAFFYNKISNYIKEPNTSSLQTTFDDLVDSLLTLFKVVVIELEDEDDAQVIFEVLNGRQTPLSASDLVKNLIFLRAEREEQYDINHLYDQYWGSFDDKWWKQKVGSGHAARAHTDRLLAAWLTAVSDKPMYDTKRLYGQMRRYLATCALEMELVLSEISEYANHYQDIYAQRIESPRIATALHRIRELGYVTVIPLLLWLKQQATYGNLETSGYEQAVLDIESYLIRRVVTRDSTREYAKIFWSILQTARQPGQSSSDQINVVIREAFCRLEGSARWPSDKTLIDCFERNDFYARMAQYVIKIILGGIEEQIRSENPQIEKAIVNYNNLTIEHIMPQKWEDNWRIKAEGNELLLAKQRRNDHIHRIGNLTLLNSPLNKLQSNHSWTNKRRALQQFTTLRMNIDLIQNSKWDKWNEKTITDRGRFLAAYATRVWPRATID